MPLTIAPPGSVDPVQMLLSRPAELNRLLEQSKVAAAAQQQQMGVGKQVVVPNGRLSTAGSLPGATRIGSLLTPGLPRAPTLSPKTSVTNPLNTAYQCCPDASSSILADKPNPSSLANLGFLQVVEGDCPTSGDETDSLQGALLPMSIQEIWLR
eukprot:gene4511-4764_t